MGLSAVVSDVSMDRVWTAPLGKFLKRKRDPGFEGRTPRERVGLD
jgi:hypothetical protein